MKKAISFLLAALMLLTLCACTGPVSDPEPEYTPDIRPTPPRPEITREPDPTDTPTSEPAAEPTPEPTPEPSPEPAPEQTPEPTPLIDEDQLIADIEWYFNQMGMNGLLQTEYDRIQDASLYEILYQTEDENIPEEDARDAYTAAFGDFDTSLSWAEEDYFANFIWAITGCSLEDFPDYERLLYDPESRCFYQPHGDTNYQLVKVDRVECGEDGVVSVYYHSGFDWESRWFCKLSDGEYGFFDEMLLVLTTETNLPCQFLPITNHPSDAEAASQPDGESETLAADIEAYFNQPGMNGMLRTAFTEITQLRLRDILYQMTDEIVSYEEAVEAYEAAFGELYLDLNYATDWYFENYIYDITGHDLTEFPTCANLLYDEDSGLYFLPHGDTNYQPMVVDSVDRGDDGYLYVCYHSDRGQWCSTTPDGEITSADGMLLVLTDETNLPCRFLPVSNQPSFG